jgi:hypothetical protein
LFLHGELKNPFREIRDFPAPGQASFDSIERNELLEFGLRPIAPRAQNLHDPFIKRT